MLLCSAIEGIGKGYAVLVLSDIAQMWFWEQPAAEKPEGMSKHQVS